MKPNNISPSKECKQCSTTFFKKNSESKRYWVGKEFCSRKCKTDASRGKPTWTKGIIVDRAKYPNMGHFQKHTPEAMKKLTDANRRNAKKHPREFFVENQKLAIKSGLARGSFKGTLGKKKELSSRWKANEASYSSKHKWIQKYWKKAGICQECGITPAPYGNRKCGTEWHSLDGKYDRENRDSWAEACKMCHNKLDKKV